MFRAFGRFGANGAEGIVDDAALARAFALATIGVTDDVPTSAQLAEWDWEDREANWNEADWDTWLGEEPTARSDQPELRCIGSWEEHKGQPVEYGRGTGKYSSVAKTTVTREDFFAELGTKALHHYDKPKDQLPTLAPCILRDYSIPTPYVDEHGKQRRPKNLKADNVTAITSLVVDVDNTASGRLQSIAQATQVLDKLGIAYAVYTTASHTPECPKFRIVIDIPVCPIATKDDALAYAAAYRLVIGKLLGVSFDTSCTDLAQYYYLPSLKLPPRPKMKTFTAEARQEFAVLLQDHNRNGPQQARTTSGFVQYFHPGGQLNFNEFVAWQRELLHQRGSATALVLGTRSKGKASRPAAYEPKTPNLKRFVFTCAKLFDIERAYQEKAPDDVHGQGNGWLNCRCGNDRGEISGRRHTKGFDDGNPTGFGVRSDRERGFACKCFTEGCSETFASEPGSDRQDRLKHLDALCQLWHVEDAEGLLKFCFDEAEARAAYDAWNNEFILSSNGLPNKHSQHNIRVALRRLGVRVRFNEFSNTEIIDGLEGFGPEIDDAALNRLWLEIDARFKFRPDQKLTFAVIEDEARRNAFNPLCDYLDDVQAAWDGVPRIDGWLSTYLGAEHTALHREFAARWLIAAVRRARKPGTKFDQMLVLESEQGRGKSTAFSILAARDEWFTDSVQLNANAREAQELLAGIWISEMAEMGGLRKGEVESVKAFISRRMTRRVVPGSGRFRAWGELVCLAAPLTTRSTCGTAPVDGGSGR